MKRNKFRIISLAVIALMVLIGVGIFYAKFMSGELTKDISNAVSGSKGSKDNSVQLYMSISDEELAEDEAKMVEYYKETPSEIEGMTMYDKMQMGLEPERDDTDRDGLTDNEELNVYGSDPKAASTAGDFYTDSYKVEHGMDLFTYVERDMSELDYPNVYCDEIAFYPNKYEDTQKVKAEYDPVYTDLEELSGILDATVYECYSITPNGCDFEIDLTKICEENEIGAEDLEIYVSGFSDRRGLAHPDEYPEIRFTKADFKLNGEKALLKNTDDYFDLNCSGTQLYLAVDKNTVPNLCNSGLLGDLGDFGNLGDAAASKLSFIGADSDDKIYAVMEGRSIMGHGGYRIYYHKTGDSKMDTRIIETMKAEAIHQAKPGAPRNDEFYLSLLEGEEVQRALDRYQEWEDNLVTVYDVSKEDVKMRLSRDRTFFPSLEVMPNQTTGEFDLIDDWAQFFIWQYYSWDSFEWCVDRKAEIDFDEYLYEYEHHYFDFETDRLPFTNYRNKISEGHCAGISVFTAKTHNKGTQVSETGEYTLPEDENITSKDYTFSSAKWDLSGDSENATLMDPGLSDYKTADFVDEDCELRITSEGEQEFANMIECFHAEMNYYAKKYCGYVYNNFGSRDLYDWENVDRIKERIKNEEILVLEMKGSGDGLPAVGHAVCIIDYEDVSATEVKLHIYDCNIPNEVQYLKVTRVNDECKEDEHGHYMIFYYDRYFNSDRAKYQFVVTDANMLFVTQTRTANEYNKATGAIKFMAYISHEYANEEIQKQRGTWQSTWRDPDSY